MGSPDGCDAEYRAWRKIKVGAVTTSNAKTPALAIRLRWRASFRKKLRQLVGKCVRKGARKRAPLHFLDRPLSRQILTK
jgi:hypothetical protein